MHSPLNPPNPVFWVKAVANKALLYMTTAPVPTEKTFSVHLSAVCIWSSQNVLLKDFVPQKLEEKGTWG